eukprot:760613-Hanusia_phi.AAC.1
MCIARSFCGNGGCRGMAMRGECIWARNADRQYLNTKIWRPETQVAGVRAVWLSSSETQKTFLLAEHDDCFQRLGAAIGILVGFLIETSLCYMPSGIAQTTSRHVQSVSTSPQISGCPATCAGNSRSLRRSRLSMISSPRNMDDQDYETSEIESAREKEVIAVKRQMVEFYNAFTSKNFEKMQKLWLQTPYIQCILPGLPFPVNGYESIMEMWETVFGTSDENFSNTVIKPSSMIVQVRGKMALVFCNEDVVNGPYSRQMHATNIYRKVRLPP